MGAQGNTTIDFGAFPGSSHTTTTVTGQAGIVAGSSAEAWIRAEASADHTADEHVVETIAVCAASITAGTGFVIHAWNTNQITEPVPDTDDMGPSQLRGGAGPQDPAMPDDFNGGMGTRLYGVWNVSWVWN